MDDDTSNAAPITAPAFTESVDTRKYFFTKQQCAGAHRFYDEAKSRAEHPATWKEIDRAVAAKVKSAPSWHPEYRAENFKFFFWKSTIYQKVCGGQEFGDWDDGKRHDDEFCGGKFQLTMRVMEKMAGVEAAHWHKHKVNDKGKNKGISYLISNTSPAKFPRLLDETVRMLCKQCHDRETEHQERHL